MPQLGVMPGATVPVWDRRFSGDPREEEETA